MSTETASSWWPAILTRAFWSTHLSPSPYTVRIPPTSIRARPTYSFDTRALSPGVLIRPAQPRFPVSREAVLRQSLAKEQLAVTQLTSQLVSERAQAQERIEMLKIELNTMTAKYKGVKNDSCVLRDEIARLRKQLTEKEKKEQC